MVVSFCLYLSWSVPSRSVRLRSPARDRPVRPEAVCDHPLVVARSVPQPPARGCSGYDPPSAADTDW